MLVLGGSHCVELCREGWKARMRVRSWLGSPGTRWMVVWSGALGRGDSDVKGATWEGGIGGERSCEHW